MTTIKAIVRNGRLETEQLIDLPDGTEILIPLTQSLSNPDNEPMSPEEIARVLEAMDNFEPFQWTDEEFAAWEADRQARKEREKAQFYTYSEKLKRMWE